MQHVAVIGGGYLRPRFTEVLSRLNEVQVPEGMTDVQLSSQQALASSRLEFQGQRPEHDPLVRERFIRQYLANVKLFQKEAKAEKSPEE